MRIYLDSVGCRLNWSEIEILARQFAATGHTVVADPSESDVIVVNTCGVTAQAERKTRHRIRCLHRDNRDARIAVIGCYSTLRAEISNGLPGVVWVIPNGDKDRTVDIVTAEPLPSSVREEPATGDEMLRTRAFIKVQDGCDNRCTFCIVPSLRGPSRSRSKGDVITEVRGLVERAGCREAVISGANLGAYGRDLGLEKGLRALVESLLAHTDVERLRLSSLEPWDIEESFFELWDDSRLCRQIHLPLQSGCDATLRRMGRPIVRDDYERLVKAAREAIPGLAVTTDVLVGFPGEDRDAFRESYGFVEQIRFAKLHVFPYSARPGTPAARLPGQVCREVRDERARRMRALGAEERRQFQESFLGRELEVLWEKRRGDGRWTGWTDNYIRVVGPGDPDLFNRITPTRLLGVYETALEGRALL